MKDTVTLILMCLEKERCRPGIQESGHEYVLCSLSSIFITDCTTVIAIMTWHAALIRCLNKIRSQNVKKATLKYQLGKT